MIDPLSNYGVIFLLNNLLHIYVVYRFMRVFYDREGVNRRLEAAAFAAYYVIHSVIYMAFDILVVTMATNMVCMLALSFLYKSSLSKKIVVTLLVYATGFCVEVLVYVVLLALKFQGDMRNVVLISGSLLILLVVLILERVQASRRKQEIVSRNWMVLLLIPIASVFISLILGIPLSSFGWVATGLACLLLINFIAFYLYDALGRYYVEESERKLLVQQNAAYARQFDLIQKSQEDLRILRHDMRNHMVALHSLLEKGDRDEMAGYLSKINQRMKKETTYVDTGNHYVDGILNFKIEEAIRAGARVSVDVQIPEKLNIDAFDLNIILGNLMDNAIEGVKGIASKEISLKMNMDRSMLFLKVQNPFNGGIRKRNGEFLTTKGGRQLRGLGLRSIQSAISRYNGTLDIEAEGYIFSASILLYNKKTEMDSLDS